MARPKKCRRVCGLPKRSRFGPADGAVESGPTVTMTVDEYEVVRLIDLEDYTQEECAKQMDVARTTVQAAYDGARKKLADSLVNGKTLVIEGGVYRLCDGLKDVCGRGACKRRGHAGARKRGKTEW